MTSTMHAGVDLSDLNRLIAKYDFDGLVPVSELQSDIVHLDGVLGAQAVPSDVLLELTRQACCENQVDAQAVCDLLLDCRRRLLPSEEREESDQLPLSDAERAKVRALIDLALNRLVTTAHNPFEPSMPLIHVSFDQMATVLTAVAKSLPAKASGALGKYKIWLQEQYRADSERVPVLEIRRSLLSLRQVVAQ